jgi:hypothetical protein
MKDDQYPKHKDDGLTGDVHEVNEKEQEFQGDEEDEEEILASESDQYEKEVQSLQERIDKATALLRRAQGAGVMARDSVAGFIDELINILEGNA